MFYYNRFIHTIKKYFEFFSYINLDYGDWIIISMAGILLGFKDKKQNANK